MTKHTKEGSTFTHKMLTVIGTIMCIVLIPILIINCTLLFKGYMNKDEVPSVGGIFPMIVLTDSMHGTFEGGDLIICKEVPASEIKEGDVITFFDPESNKNSVVSHRVLEVLEEDGKISFRTKGDTNNTEDANPIPEENLIGVYTGVHITGAGNVAMFMQTTTGLIICVVLPLILLIGYDTIRRRLYNKKHAGEKEELMAELEELRRLKAQAESENK